MRAHKLIGAAFVAVALLASSACGASGGKSSSSSAGNTTTTAAAGTTTTTAPTTTTAATTTTTPGVALDTWATGFCGSFSQWLTAIKAAGTSMSSASPDSVDAAKAQIVALFDTVGTQTKSLIAALHALGVPRMHDGAQLEADLAQKFGEFESETASAKATIQAASSADPQGFEAAVQAAIDTFRTNVTKIGDSFSALDTKYPEQDFQTALSTACADLPTD